MALGRLSKSMGAYGLLLPLTALGLALCRLADYILERWFGQSDFEEG